jgi:hypothetical protein
MSTNGPEHDRILLLEDFDPASGKARKISVFFEGTKYTMNLAVYHDGSIYVATRREIFRLRDTDNDGRADERTPICRLETPATIRTTASRALRSTSRETSTSDSARTWGPSTS